MRVAVFCHYVCSVDDVTSTYQHSCEVMHSFASFNWPFVAARCQAFTSRGIRETMYVTNIKETNSHQSSSVHSKHACTVNDGWLSLSNALQNPPTTYRNLWKGKRAKDSWSRVRRVQRYQICCWSGNQRSIQRAEKRVEERISYNSNRCVGCIEDESYSKHGRRAICLRGRIRAVQ